MALVELLFGQTQVNAKIGVVTLDASVSETHTQTSDVTEHAIESGSFIADHVIISPSTISIDGVVSNHPLSFLASLTSSSPVDNDFKRGGDRVQAAFAALEKIRLDRTPVKVVTSLKTYENYILTGLTVRRSASTGNILSFTADLKQVTLVNSIAAANPSPTPVTSSNKSPVKGGAKTLASSGAAGTAKAQSASLLAPAGKGAGSFIESITGGLL